MGGHPLGESGGRGWWGWVCRDGHGGTHSLHCSVSGGVFIGMAPHQATLRLPLHDTAEKMASHLRLGRGYAGL